MSNTASFDLIVSSCKWSLTQAQKEFIKNPTADNWNANTRAMLAYQQIMYAALTPRVDRAALVVAVGDAHPDQWPDAICRATLGLSCAEALA